MRWFVCVYICVPKGTDDVAMWALPQTASRHCTRYTVHCTVSYLCISYHLYYTIVLQFTISQYCPAFVIVLHMHTIIVNRRQGEQLRSEYTLYKSRD